MTFYLPGRYEDRVELRDISQRIAARGHTDLRLPTVLAAIHRCDASFIQGNKAAFLVAVEGVVTAMEITGHENLGFF